MKNLYFLFLAGLAINLTAQNSLLWPEEFESANKLDITDVTFESGQFYKLSDITLKAGEGVFLYMMASTFVPQLYTTDVAQQNWGFGKNSEFGTEINVSYLPVIAKNDTVINVVYSSVDKSVTGDFAYGFRKLSPAQMQFDTMNSYCDKLTFLINNWQCWWELVSLEDFYPTWGHPNKTSDISLVYKGSVFMRRDYLTSYSEILLIGNNITIAKDYYDEIIANTISCLSPAEWDITTSQTNLVEGVNKSQTTQFTIKGSEFGQITRSFEISFYCNEDNRCDVSIYFL